MGDLDPRDRAHGQLATLLARRRRHDSTVSSASPDRIPEVEGYEQTIVVVCDAGYASSLAAASLQALGLVHATDLDGGFQAWRAAGLPTTAAVTASE